MTKPGEALQATSATKYTPSEVDHGLRMVALHGGNTRRAAKELEKEGTPVPRGTLEVWKRRTHPERYRHIFVEEMPKFWQGKDERLHEVVDSHLTVQAKSNEKLIDALDNGPAIEPKDLANITRSGAVGAGVGIDKLMEIENVPQRPRAQRDVREVLLELRDRHGFTPAELEKFQPGATTILAEAIEGEAEELEPAE